MMIMRAGSGQCHQAHCDCAYQDQEPQQRERLKTLIANSETEQKIYKTGFLNKTGGGRKGLKRWKRRCVKCLFSA